MTLIELIFASILTTTLVTAIAVVLRGGYSAWQAHSGDYVKIESANATLRHIVRQVRQATSVTAITASNNASGSLSVLLPSGQTDVWTRNNATNEVNFGVTSATNLLSEGITALYFTGYKADGITATTTVAQIRAIKCQVQFTLPRDTGGARTITSWAWLRAW
jgi:hypothetical protein